MHKGRSPTRATLAVLSRIQWSRDLSYALVLCLNKFPENLRDLTQEKMDHKEQYKKQPTIAVLLETYGDKIQNYTNRLCAERDRRGAGQTHR